MDSKLTIHHRRCDCCYLHRLLWYVNHEDWEESNLLCRRCVEANCGEKQNCKNGTSNNDAENNRTRDADTVDG